MNRLYLILFFCAQSLYGFTQLLHDTVSIRNSSRINQSTNIGHSATFFSDCDTDYFYQDNEPIFTLRVSRGVWVSGIDSVSNKLYLSASSYFNPNYGLYDYQPGALNRETGKPLDVELEVFNTIWVFKDEEIKRLRELYINGRLCHEDLPIKFRNYPAKGNPWYKQNSNFEIDFDLAPFFDSNKDGIYNPLNGDFPIALEENPYFLPVEFSYSIFNDLSSNRRNHSEPLGIEFQQTNYVVQCENHDELNNTVFTRLKYVHFNPKIIDLRIGLFEDVDLGCYSDDYIGCDTITNSYYMYNPGPEFDPCDTSIKPNETAIRNTTLLNKKMNSFIYYRPDGHVPEVSGPGVAPQYQLYLNGLFIAGDSIRAQGRGYENDDSIPSTLFAFPDFPNLDNGWSLNKVTSLFIREHVTVANLDLSEVNDLKSGTIDFADMVIYSTDSLGLNIFDDYRFKIDMVKMGYEQFIDDPLECCYFNIGSDHDTNIDNSSIYPNPATNDLIISCPVGASIKIYNLKGQLVDETYKEQALKFKIDVSNYPTGLYLVKLLYNHTELMETHLIDVVH